LGNKSSELIDLVNKENVSAIRILADRLDITPERVMSLLEESLTDGKVQGSFSEDGERFYKSEIKLSDAPVIHSKDQAPEFMKFDNRPGIIAVIMGFSIIIFGLFVNANAIDLATLDFGAIVLFVGVLVLIIGMYYLSRRKTPS
jgi:hypothetical protein